MTLLAFILDLMSFYQQLVTEISRAKIGDTLNFNDIDIFFMPKITASTIFHLFDFSICINFIQIARQWKFYINKWSEISKSFNALMIVDMKAKETESRLFRWFIAFTASFGFSYVLNKLKTFGVTPSCYSERKGDTPSFQFIFYEEFPELNNVIPANFVFYVCFLWLDFCMAFIEVFNQTLIVILSQMLMRRFELLNRKLSTGVSELEM